MQELREGRSVKSSFLRRKSSAVIIIFVLSYVLGVNKLLAIVFEKKVFAFKTQTFWNKISSLLKKPPVQAEFSNRYYTIQSQSNNKENRGGNVIPTLIHCSLIIRYLAPASNRSEPSKYNRNTTIVITFNW